MSMSESEYVDYLVGRRPFGVGARCFMPDDDLRPVPVPQVRDWVWNSRRRLVGRRLFPDPHFVSVITLFIPVWDEPGEPLLYESIVVQGTKGERVERVATVEEARTVHQRLVEEWSQRLGVSLPSSGGLPE